MDAHGKFVVVWTGEVSAGQDPDVFLQRFDAAGAFGGETRVNTVTTANQQGPDVASDLDGNLVIVWEDHSRDGVYAQRYAPSGLSQGPEFLVASNAREPAVAIAPSGNKFVVVWHQPTPQTIKARLYSGNGNAIGDEFEVPFYTTGGDPRFPSVAWLPVVDGQPEEGFVAVWNRGTGPDGDTVARVYNVTGRRFLDPEFVVADNTTVETTYSAVASDNTGSFVVAWASSDATGHIRARRFNSSGDKVGSEITVSLPNSDSHPRVAMTPEGEFVVAWNRFPSAGVSDVYGRQFSVGGAPIGNEFPVNTYTTGPQTRPSVTTSGSRDFLVSWTSTQGEGGVVITAVYGQRFGFDQLRPAALDVDPPPGNGVWDGFNEVLMPKWTNLTGSQQDRTGTLSQIACPSGFYCEAADGSAQYRINPNETEACDDPPCYTVSIVGIGIASLGHRDGGVLESLRLGTEEKEKKNWKLHIGESFTDVPKTSPYYRYVETLLHRGVTGGCTATTFCPNNSVPREQLPLFLLVAKEGALYSPPDCTTKPFPDVEVDSPFCRWIQELLAREVIGGCGGGNYCPQQAVTREQFPLFALKTIDPNLNPPACTTKPFPDVEINNPFCRWIKAAVDLDMVSGGACGGGNYCPTDPITRGDMAIGVVEGLHLTLYGP